MTLQRQITAKKAWARLSERAESGETFGYVACLGFLYKMGVLTREQVLEQLNLAHVTREDLRKFREHTNTSRVVDKLNELNEPHISHADLVRFREHSTSSERC